MNKIDSNKVLPFFSHPILNEESINITFHDVNQMDYKEFRKFSFKIREFLKRVWIEKDIPPYIGLNHEEIINDFKSLYSKNISSIYKKTSDKNYEFIIQNNYSNGISCNQFFPSLYKVKVGNISTWDLITNEEFLLRWIRTIVKNLKQDLMFQFSTSFNDKNDLLEISKEYGLLIQQSKSKNELTFTREELLLLHSNKLLQDYHITNIEFEFENHQDFEIRYYNKNQRIIKKLIHIIRTSSTSTSGNFNPVISKFIYEHYLPKNKKNTVYDPCSGFGGRLLGSFLSKRKIHYIGTDVNKSLFEPINSYESLGKFVSKHITSNNSYHIDSISSDEMDESKELKKHMGKVDLIFTSPPYFNKERYSDDKEQSIKKYPYYDIWVTNYLFKTFSIGYESLRKGGICLVNISDVIVNTHSLPLEIDTIRILEQIGFTYQYQIGMELSNFMGYQSSKVINRYWDEESEQYKKVEPILVFKK